MVVDRAVLLLAVLSVASLHDFCHANAVMLTENTKFLSGATVAGGDQFGNAVAISRNTVLVGAYQDELGAAGSAGVVEFYSPNNAGEWARTARLGGSEFGGQLGWSVALSGDTAVAGARLADRRGTDSGSMTVYQKSASGVWLAAATLIGRDIRSEEQFGISVGVDQGTIVAGSSSHNSNAGAAFVFQTNGVSGWEEVAKLTANDPAAGDTFGVGVAVSGNRVIVGAPGKRGGENWVGAAYVFEESSAGNFPQVAKLQPADFAEGLSFGRSVSIAGATAIVGAPGLNGYDTTGGAAYVFGIDHNGNWIQRAKLIAAEQFAGDQFGISVALGNGIAVIGSPGDDDLGSGGGTDPGAAYVFRESVAGDWSLSHILRASDGSAGDGFGRSVAIYGSRVLVGAQFNDDKGSASGSAYLFVVPEPASAAILLSVVVLAMVRSPLGTARLRCAAPRG